MKQNQAAAPNGAPHLSTFATWSKNPQNPQEIATQLARCSSQPPKGQNTPRKLEGSKVSSNLHRKETAFPQQIFLPLNVSFQPSQPSRCTSQGYHLHMHRQVFGTVCNLLLVRVSKREKKQIRDKHSARSKKMDTSFAASPYKAWKIGPPPLKVPVSPRTPTSVAPKADWYLMATFSSP